MWTGTPRRRHSSSQPVSAVDPPPAALAAWVQRRSSRRPSRRRGRHRPRSSIDSRARQARARRRCRRRGGRAPGRRRVGRRRYQHMRRPGHRRHRQRPAALEQLGGKASRPEIRSLLGTTAGAAHRPPGADQQPRQCQRAVAEAEAEQCRVAGFIGAASRRPHPCGGRWRLGRHCLAGPLLMPAHDAKANADPGPTPASAHDPYSRQQIRRLRC